MVLRWRSASSRVLIEIEGGAGYSGSGEGGTVEDGFNGGESGIGEGGTVEDGFNGGEESGSGEGGTVEDEFNGRRLRRSEQQGRQWQKTSIILVKEVMI
jgi:hypothetical protein